MKIPRLVSTSWGYNKYNVKDVQEFKDSLNFYDVSTISNNIVYLQCKNISQSKLREAGFKITRDLNKADFIVIEDVDYIKSHSYIGTEINLPSNSKSYFDQLEVIYNINPNCKYVYNHELYRFLYKYIGDYELYSNLDELLKTENRDNTKMAMELMTNANWSNNEIYLKKLFKDHWNYNIARNQYKTSISFTGFLDTLDFDPSSIYFNNPDDYRAECKNEEHHQFVFNLYKQQFEDDLQNLLINYKIKLNSIDYEIDKSIYK